MQNIIRRNKKYLTLVIILVITGLILGILYFNVLSLKTKESIILTLSNETNYNYNFIIKHLIIMSISLVSAFFGIGIFLGLFYIFYEGFSVGFLLGSFFLAFKIKGIFFLILYLIINKLLTFILIIIFIRKIINISRFMIGTLIYKKNHSIREKVLINLKKSLYIIVFVLVINIILCYISPVIFKFLASRIL